MTITDEKYFREHSDVVQVSAYALHDVLHSLKNDNCECLVSKEDGHLIVHYCKKQSETSDDKSSACKDGNIEQDASIPRQQFDSLVSSILRKFPNASLSEFNGQSVIKYHGGQFDLKNIYLLSKHPNFVRLLEQDMRTLDNYDYILKCNMGEPMINLHDWNDISNSYK